MKVTLGGSSQQDIVWEGQRDINFEKVKKRHKRIQLFIFISTDKELNPQVGEFR